MDPSTGARRVLADPLAQRSVDVLKAGQAGSGAFIASPAFPVYRYAWLRDGAFCAHGLDAIGERAAASAWHGWVERSVEAHRNLIESAVARVSNGETPPPESMPPARYTLDGTLEHHQDDEPWPNFQVDGYGMWLWALEEHLAGGKPGPETAKTVELVARYLGATWKLKSFSCWEELDGGEHASTLGAVFAGLAAAARLLDEAEHRVQADRVRDALLARFVENGRFRRGPDDPRLDGSLLWLGVPFGVLPLDEPLLTATVAAVRDELTGPDGGVYRYRGDTYYGGGEWLLLTSSLAWHAASVGDSEAFEHSRAWVRAQALANGDLPEQVTASAQEPEMVEPWERRWGPVATPLLWSHAMYLLAESAGD
jgi:GH15 family glucan-1,4-alpha-glucosidase